MQADWLGAEPEVEIVDFVTRDGAAAEHVTFLKTGNRSRIRVSLLVLIAVVFGWLLVSGGDDPVADVQPGPQVDGIDRMNAVLLVQSIPRPLVAVELYAAEPSGDRLRDLFEAIGGFEGLELATAEGAFDLVRFDPLDSNHLLASNRLSYGDAENQQTNEDWTISDEGDVDQRLWNPSVSHDFAHFNIDGTITMWVHGGGDEFAPRTAAVLIDSQIVSARTQPIYASRFSTVNGTVFALTGNGDYSTQETGYVDLIAANGARTTELAAGSKFGWIENPTPELLVAYPSSPNGVTAVWDVSSLEALPNHPLASRKYQRVAVSGDRTIAVGATTDGPLEVINLVSGRTLGTFGTVDVTGVDQAITLNHDGTVAISVEQSGRVRIWWVGQEDPVASTLAGATQPRWVSQQYAATSASAVALDTTRIALRIPARADEPTRWSIVDTDVESWKQRACALAGRSLRPSEASAMGLAGQPLYCAG